MDVLLVCAESCLFINFAPVTDLHNKDTYFLILNFA